MSTVRKYKSPESRKMSEATSFIRKHIDKLTSAQLIELSDSMLAQGHTELAEQLAWFSLKQDQYIAARNQVLSVLEK